MLACTRLMPLRCILATAGLGVLDLLRNACSHTSICSTAKACIAIHSRGQDVGHTGDIQTACRLSSAVAINRAHVLATGGSFVDMPLGAYIHGFDMSKRMSKEREGKQISKAHEYS